MLPLLLRCHTLRLRIKQLEQHNRQLERQLNTARDCIRMQAEKNFLLYNQCRRCKRPQSAQILELTER
ncbi:hypothetical protein BTJ39_20755 [Izhakiella australiensis]|uniref:Uncharacterized protein n=1 Tax=Izhakiella australiensis TaxID=1926881 RepID=A0A1S8YDY3_9GAMM|nr:hypothetical protein BTJ39_20755 [Izhakiella australiensis]